MTPEEKIALDQHVQAIAKILYADADKSQMTNLGQIEAGIRAQIQAHVSPQLGVFLSQQLQEPIDLLQINLIKPPEPIHSCCPTPNR